MNIVFILIIAIVALVFTIMFLFSLLGKSGRAILAAKVKHTPLLLVLRKTGNFVLTTGKDLGQVIKSKGGKPYITDPETMRYLDGIRLGLAYEKSSLTVPMEVAAATGELKKQGIKNIDEAEDIEPAFKAELEKLNQAEEKVQQEKAITQDKDKKEALDVETEAIKEEKDMIKTALQNIHTVADYVKYRANPTFITEAVRTLVSMQLEDEKSNKTLKLIGAAIAFFIVAIGFYIILTKLGGGGGGVETIKSAANAGKNVANSSII